MKIIKISVCLLCSFVLLISCQTNKKKTQEIAVNDNLQVIDVDNAKEEDKILLSDLFSSVKTIILETKDDILLGKINGIQVYKDLIFVMDSRRNIGVYIFNKEGKFIRKIGNRGMGPGEYLKISDFTIDEDNENIYLMDCDAKKIYKYKITGKFENAIALENANIQSFHIQYSKGHLYTDISYMDDTENGCMMQEIDLSTGKQKKGWLDSHRYNKNWKGLLQRETESFFYSRNQESFKFIHYFMDTIISFHADYITPVFVLKDKNWITSEDVLQIKNERDKNGGMISFGALTNKNIAFTITNYVEWDDFVCFQYQKKDDLFFVLHDVSTNTTQYTTILMNDLVYGKPVLSGGFTCSDSNGVYEVLNIDMLDRFIERTKEEGFLNSDLDKIEQLKNLSEDSNPVIFCYEF
jgi:hypothetical protein